MARSLDGAGLREVLRDVLAGGESERRVMAAIAGTRDGRAAGRSERASVETPQAGRA